VTTTADARAEKVVVLLREAGLPWSRIAQHAHVSQTTCRKFWQRHLEDGFAQLDVAGHRAAIAADLELVLDTLRPSVCGGPVAADAVHPDKGDVMAFLKALATKANLLGAQAPRQVAVEAR
jgi:hypothetical protein